MSYLEFIGTVFNLSGVWLTAKNKIVCWPVGIIGVVLYAILFYQIRLYSDFFEQLYYFFTGFAGWWLWTHPKATSRELPVTRNSSRGNIVLCTFLLVTSVVVGFEMSRAHIDFPTFFREPASFPYLDALTTVFSFGAQWLMTKKKIESWYIWIVVDLFGVGIYYQKEIKLISLEYALFTILACGGLLHWKKGMLRREGG
jgi:nicotinamide mononucleotide transporter